MAHIDLAAQWPQINNYFRVEIDGMQFSVAEVSGLEREVDVIDYRPGDEPMGIKQSRAGIFKAGGRVTLKKAIYEGDNEIEERFNAMQDNRSYMSVDGDRFDVVITLLDENENDIEIWNLHQCWPYKVVGTTLKADDSSYAAEEMHLVFEHMERRFA